MGENQPNNGWRPTLRRNKMTVRIEKIKMQQNTPYLLAIDIDIAGEDSLYKGDLRRAMDALLLIATELGETDTDSIMHRIAVDVLTVDKVEYDQMRTAISALLHHYYSVVDIDTTCGVVTWSIGTFKVIF